MAGSDELDELCQLDASETDPEGDEDDQDDDHEDEDEDGEGIKPEGMPHG